MTGQPTPTHTHTWDGTGTLPDWLTGHRWTAGQLVIRTPDGDTRPQAGWWLIGWTDGSVTAATPTVAERVYGDDGIAGQLERAEEEINRLTAAEAADIAAGSYAGRAEELEASLARQAQETATWRATANTLNAGGPGTPRNRAEQAETELAGVRTLRDRWITAGPPPLGTSINRWWDRRLVELNAALDPKGN